MVDINYSRNAPLLDIEEYDYDTSDKHETGINEDRLRLPSRYDIAKYYKRDVSKPSSYDEYGNPRYEKGRWTKKEIKPDIMRDFDWQITYRFPSALHPSITESGVTYGGKNVTYRRLYLILCEHFNNGEFFIEEYFNSVYPYTMKEIIDNELQPLKEQIVSLAENIISQTRVTKKGTLDQRLKATRVAEEELDLLDSMAREEEEVKGEHLAELIKEDIINAVTTGQLPCQFLGDSAETRRKRIKAGLEPAPRFSATEKLIRSIQLFVRIGGNKKWQTNQGILV